MFKISLDALRKGLGIEDEPGDERAREQNTRAAEDMEIGGQVGPYARPTRQAKAVPPFKAGEGEGVDVEPVPVTADSQITIRYSGLLANAGAQQVTLHYGYGPGEWRKVSDITMQKQPDGTWATSIKVEDTGRFDFCFRDNAYNWDNNNGRNWSYEIHNGGAYH